MDEAKWKKWSAWHNDWKERNKETTKQIKRYYQGKERKERLKQATKDFMQEFWITRKEILGW